MWSRKDLKEKSKARFHVNYWRAVLVALILTVIVGGSSMYSYHFSNPIHNDEQSYSYEETYDSSYDSGDDYDISAPYEETVANGIEEVLDGTFLQMDPISFAIMLAVFAVIFIIILAIVLVLSILVFGPLEIGCKRFFNRNLNEDAQVKEICYSFDNGYKNAVKTMFFRGLYTFLWSLLFVIPGIVKSYEYRMIPYLLGENPQMSTDEAFAVSRQMMTGNKWKAFVLDLSFIGWEILSGITGGIVGIFYVNPYYHQTCAALYEALKIQNIPENNMQ